MRTKRRIWRSSSISSATGAGSLIEPMIAFPQRACALSSDGLRFLRRYRWRSQRQREREARAAVRVVLGRDLAVMRFDDGAADRETQSDARRGRLARRRA